MPSNLAMHFYFICSVANFKLIHETHFVAKTTFAFSFELSYMGLPAFYNLISEGT